MNPTTFPFIRRNITLISGDPNQENHVRSGVRVLEVMEDGIQVQRIHASYLADEPIESWRLRWDQLERSTWEPLPVGTQIPLI